MPEVHGRKDSKVGNFQPPSPHGLDKPLAGHLPAPLWPSVQLFLTHLRAGPQTPINSPVVFKPLEQNGAQTSNQGRFPFFYKTQKSRAQTPRNFLCKEGPSSCLCNWSSPQSRTEYLHWLIMLPGLTYLQSYRLKAPVYFEANTSSWGPGNTLTP